MTTTYYPTHIRMGAWLVGVLLGYILHNLKGKSIKVPKVRLFVKLKNEHNFTSSHLNLDIHCNRLVHCNRSNSFHNLWNLLSATTRL